MPTETTNTPGAAAPTAPNKNCLLIGIAGAAGFLVCAVISIIVGAVLLVAISNSRKPEIAIEQGPVQPHTGNKLEDNYVTGVVTDTQGKPIKGVEVMVDNTMSSWSYSLGSTDEKGHYRIQLSPVGTYKATAKLKVNYNGRDYELDLHPSSSEAISAKGGTVNFQWKLTGKRPNSTYAGVYGASVSIYPEWESEIEDEQNIEFTLEPVGPLIDGSKGATLRLRPGKSGSPDFRRLQDIPIGKYRVSAVYKGKAIKLRRNLIDDDYFPSIEIEFEPNNVGSPSYSIMYKN